MGGLYELFQLLESQINLATAYPQWKAADLPTAGSYNQMACETCESAHIKQKQPSTWVIFTGRLEWLKLVIS